MIFSHVKHWKGCGKRLGFLGGKYVSLQDLIFGSHSSLGNCHPYEFVKIMKKMDGIQGRSVTSQWKPHLRFSNAHFNDLFGSKNVILNSWKNSSTKEYHFSNPCTLQCRQIWELGLNSWDLCKQGIQRSKRHGMTIPKHLNKWQPLQFLLGTS